MRRRPILVSILLIAGLGLTLVGVSATIGETSTQQIQNDSLSVTSGEKPVLVTTTYPTDDNSQAISVNITVAPEEARITNITLTILNSNQEQAFVDFDSFSIEDITPSDAAEPSGPGGNAAKQYEIDSLSEGERVEIEFKAYPRQLQATEGTIEAARITYEFRRGGIQIPENDPPGTIQATTNLSNSLFYQFEDLREQYRGLENNSNGNGGDGPLLPGFLVVLFGVVGIGAGAVGVWFGLTNSGTSRPSVDPRVLERYANQVENIGNDAENEMVEPHEVADQLEDLSDDMEEDAKNAR